MSEQIKVELSDQTLEVFSFLLSQVVVNPTQKDADELYKRFSIARDELNKVIESRKD